jgi:hypothetical protein
MYLSEMKSVLKRIHRGISERSAISYAAAETGFIKFGVVKEASRISNHNYATNAETRVHQRLSFTLQRSNAYSNRLLPLVVVDSASFFYDTKLDKKFLCRKMRSGIG